MLSHTPPVFIGSQSPCRGCTCKEKAGVGAGQPWKAKGSGSGAGQFPKLLTASEAWLVLELASPFICLMASSFLADGAGGRREAPCQKVSSVR